MEKTLKRQIGYKTEKKSAVKTSTAPVVTPPEPKEKKVFAAKAPVIKMGRKEKAPEDRVQGARVYLTIKEIATIEEKHGSLTAAIKTLLNTNNS